MKEKERTKYEINTWMYNGILHLSIIESEFCKRTYEYWNSVNRSTNHTCIGLLEYFFIRKGGVSGKFRRQGTVKNTNDKKISTK